MSLRHNGKIKEFVCGRGNDLYAGVGGQRVSRGEQRTGHRLMLAWVNT